MKKHTIKTFSLLAGLFASMLAAGASPASELQARLVPETVSAGERFALQLSSASGHTPELLSMPPFPPQGRSHQTRSDLNTTQITVSYHFLAGEPGEYEIGPLPVNLGGKTLHTPRFKLKVVKPEDLNLPGGDSVFARGFFAGGERKEYYVGEDIPIFLQVFYPADGSCDLRLNYPEIDIGKSVFHDYRAENPQNPNFARPTESRQRIDGRLFHRIGFQSAFRPLAPGQLRVAARIPSTLLLPQTRRSRDFFDDFFGGGNYRSLPKTLSVAFPEITIRPLPEPPAGTLFTGLIGHYNGTLRLSHEKVEAREPLTLTLTLEGASGSETLRAPELQLKRCRVYPPETLREPGRLRLNYVIIPLQSGPLNIRAAFSVFDPQSGRYREWKIDQTVAVAPSSRPAAAESDDYTASPFKSPGNNGKGAERNTMLYCKDAPAGARYADSPFRPGACWWLFLAAGPLFFIIHELCFRRRARLAGDPERRRRDRAASGQAALARRIRTVPDAELPRLITGEVTGYLCDRWGLPPGATPENAAEAAADPDLAEVLRRGAELSYLPPALAEDALRKDGARMRKVLLRSIKLAIFFLSFCLPLSAAGTITEKEPADWAEALSAYDRGEYPQAESFFLKQLQQRGDDPHVLYNLGCIKAAEEAPEKALWYLERAALRNPGDSATQENLNLLRRKFFLPEKGKGATPYELLLSLRDRFRPDRYLLLGAFFWFLLWVVFSFRRSLGTGANWILRGVLLGLLGLSLLAFAGQLTGSYSADRGVIVEKSVELHSLPGRHNGRKVGVVAGGTPVKIVEERREYLHIAGGDQEGWVPAATVGKLP